MWDFFDSIYCINLRERQDRYQHMVKLFDKLDISDKTNKSDGRLVFFHPERHPISGQQGCYESHLNVIKKAYQSGDKYTLIFEDDVFPTKTCNDHNLKKIISFIQSHPNLDIFYLAYVPLLNLEAPKHIENGIYHVRAASASSYIVSRKFMEKMLSAEKYVGIPVDLFYALASNHAYCLGDSMFYSKEFTSDIERSTKNKRKFLSIDLDSWMALTHWYVKHINLSLTQLTVLLILVTVIVFLMWIFDPRPKILWIFITIVVIFVLYLLIRENLIIETSFDPR